jgi:oxygen-independent coproporphyrinogen-3 oxidase
VLNGARHATSAERIPELWVERVERDSRGWIECSRLTPAEEADERLLMGLRLSEGIELEPSAAVSAALDDLIDLELVEIVPCGGGERRVRATPQGRFVLNEIVLRLSMSLASETRAHSPMDF